MRHIEVEPSVVTHASQKFLLHVPHLPVESWYGVWEHEHLMSIHSHLMACVDGKWYKGKLLASWMHFTKTFTILAHRPAAFQTFFDALVARISPVMA